MTSKRQVKVFITGDAAGFKKAADSASASGASIGSTLKKIGAGIALGTLAKGVMSVATQFQDLALGAKNFATASGLNVEQASRWQEVAGDLGVDAGKIEGALGKLSKGLGKDAEKWKDLGVTVKRTADGQVDANATLLNAIGVLHDTKDPLAKAKLGSELFGKSWADLAPLIEKGAFGVADALQSVGDAQVINEDEVKKAEKFRDTMDNFHDKIDGVKYAFAVGLMPIIGTFAETIGNLDPKLVALIGTIGVGVIVLGKLGDAGRGLTGVLNVIQAHPLIAGVGLALGGIALLITNWDKVVAVLDAVIARLHDIADFVSGPIKSIANFFGADIGNQKGQAQLGDSYNADPVLQQATQHRKDLATWNATLQQQDLDKWNAAAAKNGQVHLEGTVKKWTGGHLGGRGPVLTGERGPELFWPGGAGRMSNSRETAGMMGGRGGMVNNWQVTVRDDSDIRKIDRRLARYQARLDQGRGRPTVVPATR